MNASLRKYTRNLNEILTAMLRAFSLLSFSGSNRLGVAAFSIREKETTETSLLLNVNFQGAIADLSQSGEEWVSAPLSKISSTTHLFLSAEYCG